MHRFIVLPALLAIASAAQAAPAAPFQLAVSQTRQLPISGSALYVAVGDDTIAAVNVISSRIVMIVGKKTGVTNIVVFDQGGHTLYDGDIAVSAPTGTGVTIIRGSVSTENVCAPTCQAAPSGGGQIAANSAPAAAPAAAAGPAAAPSAAAPAPAVTARAASLTR